MFGPKNEKLAPKIENLGFGNKTPIKPIDIAFGVDRYQPGNVHNFANLKKYLGSDGVKARQVFDYLVDNKLDSELSAELYEKRGSSPDDNKYSKQSKTLGLLTLDNHRQIIKGALREAGKDYLDETKRELEKSRDTMYDNWVKGDIFQLPTSVVSMTPWLVSAWNETIDDVEFPAFLKLEELANKDLQTLLVEEKDKNQGKFFKSGKTHQDIIEEESARRATIIDKNARRILLVKRFVHLQKPGDNLFGNHDKKTLGL